MRAVFLDKDGTLLRDVPYNADPNRMVFAPGAPEALASLARAGYALVVVSNQSGVARGLIPPEALPRMAARLRELVNDAGADLLDVLFCPHHPAGRVPGYAIACSCRKPAPGMLIRAAATHGIDLAASWMVGDILDDVQAGHRAGCRSALVVNGGETEWLMSEDRVPDLVATDLPGAASGILRAEVRVG